MVWYWVQRYCLRYKHRRILRCHRSIRRVHQLPPRRHKRWDRDTRGSRCLNYPLKTNLTWLWHRISVLACLPTKQPCNKQWPLAYKYGISVFKKGYSCTTTHSGATMWRYIGQSRREIRTRTSGWPKRCAPRNTRWSIKAAILAHTQLQRAQTSLAASSKTLSMPYTPPVAWVTTARRCRWAIWHHLSISCVAANQADFVAKSLQNPRLCSSKIG